MVSYTAYLGGLGTLLIILVVQLVDTTELQFDLSGSQCSILWAGNGVVFYPDDTEDNAIVFRDSTDLVDNLIINGRPFIEIADTVLAGYFF